MKNKIMAIAVIFIVLLGGFSRVKAAFDYNINETALQNVIDYELERNGSLSLQDFVDNSLLSLAGTGIADWIIINLRQSGYALDYEEYNNKLNEYIDSKNNLNATDLERIALVKMCFGKDEEWIKGVIDEQTGKRGIMSYIYGLMLLNYGEYNTRLYAEKIEDSIVSFQLEDGSFSVAGKAGDIDVTAMALQAMAPSYLKQKDRYIYKENIEKAFAYISDNRLENNGFASMGVENIESLAQVILAYCAYGRLEQAEIYIEKLLSHQNEDGGFPHLPGGDSNEIACYQAYEALLAAKRAKDNQGFIYNKITVNKENPESESASAPDNKSALTGRNIKSIMFALTGIIFLATVIFFIIKKKKIYHYLILIPVTAGISCFISFSKIETKAEHYGRTVTGDTTTKIIIKAPEGKVILPETEIKINDGESAFTQLSNASAEFTITLDYSGSELFSNIYIRGINGISEFDYGKNSGWTYTVNGEYPNVSSAAVCLHEGDLVSWIYTKGE